MRVDHRSTYVNVSKQNINRSSPAVLDMIINDLAGQYAIETEEETADVLHLSNDTIKRDWRLAKLWLLREMEGAPQ